MEAPDDRPRRPSGDETRQRLLDCGARFFARHGVDGVELRTIQEAAGTKNQTAVRYHFGDRDGLARAILERHVLGVERRRARLLEQLEADGATGDLHRLLDALITPMTAGFDTGVGRAELRLAALLSHPDLGYTMRPFGLVDAPSGTALARLLGRAMPTLPDTLRRERGAILRDQVIQLVGLRARLIDDRDPPEPDHTDEIWHANLIDVLAAGLMAPASERTTALLAARDHT